MTTNQEKDVAYLTESQIDLLRRLPEEVKLIMLGCDTEFFQNKNQAIKILRELSGFGRDISMVTKIPISEAMVSEIREIYSDMKAKNRILSISVSLPCISEPMLAKYEPKVPASHRRIEALKNIAEAGIPAMVAIRPLLPDISDQELKSIIDLTKNYVVGYYSGPLYLNDDRIEKLLPKTVAAEEAKQPHWMLDGNTFKEVVKLGQMEILKSLVLASGKQFFEGAAEGMKFIREDTK